jgi:hypothetical protein
MAQPFESIESKQELVGFGGMLSEQGKKCGPFWRTVRFTPLVLR